MKVYLLVQDEFHEGNFGDLEESPQTIHGVYSSRYWANKAMSKINQDSFQAQFGKGERTCHIIPMELITKV